MQTKYKSIDNGERFVGKWYKEFLKGFCFLVRIAAMDF